MSDRRREKILLVEDNTDTTHQLAMLLKDVTDDEIASATSLAEARAILHRDLPHKLVVDLQLPDGDGNEFIAEARDADPCSLIVAATAYGADGARKRTMDAGADVFLVKPVTVEGVMKALGLEYPPKAVDPPPGSRAARQQGDKPC